jgi:hypothetical protein
MFIACELGKYGITVNAYAPGMVESVLSEFLCSNASCSRKNLSFNRRRVKSSFWSRYAFHCEYSLERSNRFYPRGVRSWSRALRSIAWESRRRWLVSYLTLPLMALASSQVRGLAFFYRDAPPVNVAPYSCIICEGQSVRSFLS